MLGSPEKLRTNIEAQSPTSNGSLSPESGVRPQMKSWGSTTVNRRLQELVLKEVFTAPTIHKHRHHGRQHLSTSHLPAQKVSAATSTHLAHHRSSTEVPVTHSPFTRGMTSAHPMEIEEEAIEFTDDVGVPLHPSRTGPDEEEEYVENGHGSDPSGSFSRTSNSRLVFRRHSGGGLRRRPIDVVAGKRSNLEFHEEDGYGGDGEDGVFAMDDDDQSSRVSTPAPNGRAVSPMPPALKTSSLSSTKETTTPAENPVEPTSPIIAQNPCNPEQAQVDKDERDQLFLLLEDLTAGMSKPCVLDLKMGTRQYGVEADEKKQRSQRRKCAMTTSRELGVRVCGMQVWNIKSQSYIFEDKYFGRDLKAGAEFQAALTRFFFDGMSHDSALQHIPAVLEMLVNLEQMIRNLPGYRFYASSLLILYDRGSEDKGDGVTIASSIRSPLSRADSEPLRLGTHPPQKTPLPSIKLKIVDFANCVTAEDHSRSRQASIPPRDPTGVDRGYLRGLRTLKVYFQRIWKELNDGEWVERGEGEGMALDQRGAGRGTARMDWDNALPFDDSSDVSV